MNTVFPRLITAGRHYSPVAMTADEQRLPLQRGIVETFDAHKKGVEVEMGDITLRTRHGPKILISLVAGGPAVPIFPNPTNTVKTPFFLPFFKVNL